NNFINEIAWHYGTYVGQTKNNYPRKHDTILIYGKTSEHYFCMQRDGNLESDANYKRWKKFFTTDNKIIGSNYPKDDSKFDGYVKRFIKENGREPKTVKDILLDIDGKLVDSVWEIQSINPMSKERTDYPTQKPEELIQRIILSSSQVGDIVFDCFMGSGTTQAVAMKLGRRFLGADINLGAIQTTTKRLLKVSEELNGQLETEHPFYTGFEVYNVNDYDFFRNELEAKRLICEAMGMEQLPDSTVYDALLDGRKVCILGINRIATASEFAKLLNNVNISEWQSRQKENPTKPVEEITFVCMGHDPNLKAQFEEEVSKMGFKVDVEIIDLLRDKKDLRFKRDSDAKIVIKNNKLIIENFFPMNLLQKLSIEKTDVSNWKELAESVFIDWNYDGVTFSPELTDIPEKNELVKGEYAIPKSAGTIHIKITDLISESWEGNVEAE
ncbi:MAG: site-specific DNA-methyltransferase, partial [Spirochaetia bacterium]|nr:site-specific DNA-methyltransferase [Spirochaetia bacterium]